MYYYTNSGKARAKAQDVFREIEGVSKEIASKLKEYFEGIDAPATVSGLQKQFRPAVDLTADDVNLYIRAEIPGVSKQDIQVVMRGSGTLEISGVKTNVVPEGETELGKNERRYGRFTRSIEIPEEIEVSPEGITAQYQDGVLTITLPKSEADPGVTINVQ